MSLHLAHFPSEVLSRIFDHLPAPYVYLATHLSGDRLIRHKSSQGGVVSLQLGRVSILSFGFKTLADYGGLTRLSIHYNGFSPIHWNLFPSHLLSLHIRASHPYWLAAPLSADFDLHPGNMLFHEGGKGPFNFKDHFTRLTNLDLELPFARQSRNVFNFQRLCLLVNRLLPATLETLSLSDLPLVPPSMWNFSPGLTIISLYQLVTNDFLKSVVTFAPHTRFQHLDCIATSTAPISKDIMAKLNVKTVSFWPIVFTPQVLVQQCQDLANARTEGTKLVGLNVQGLLASPNGNGEVNGSSWPSSITSMTFTKITPDLLPHGLRHLEVGTLDRPDVPSFYPWDLKAELPKHLTSLRFTHTGHIIAWPAHLTDLTFNTTDWTTEMSNNLPKGLKKLHLSHTRDSQSFEWIAHLPNTLTEFRMTARVRDVELEALPPSVTIIQATNVMYTGRLLRNSAPKTLEVTQGGYLGRLADASIVFFWADAPYQGDWSETLFSRLSPIYALEWLPASLTHLKFAYLNDIGDSLSLPNLVWLSVPRISKWNWAAHSTPKLARLTVNGTSPDDLAMILPESVTHLEAGKVDHSSSHIPPSLSQQLRILALEHDDLGYSTYPLLHTLALKFSGKVDRKIPTSVTDLTLHGSHFGMSWVFDLKPLFSHLPSLRRLKVAKRVLQTSEMKLFVDPLERLECDQLEIKEAEQYLPPLDSSLSVPHLDVGQAVIAGVKTRFPNLVLSDGFKYECSFSKYPDWRRCMFTSMTYGTGLQLPPRFGSTLPSATLTVLDILNVPVPSGASYHLPSTLTDLKIRTWAFTPNCYLHLPRGLKVLEIDAAKFYPKHALGLPPFLQSFTLTYKRLILGVLSSLPHSLESLTVNGATTFELFNTGLPPHLRNLKIRIGTYCLSRIDFSSLPTSLETYTHFNLDTKHNYFGSLSAERKLEILDKTVIM